MRNIQYFDNLLSKKIRNFLCIQDFLKKEGLLMICLYGKYLYSPI